MRAETVTLTNMCMIYDDKGNVVVQDRIDDKWGGLTLEEMKSGNLASDMEGMLRVFLEDDINEFHYEIKDGEWRYTLK